MYYILRTKTNRIIAQFPELCDAYTYCNKVLQLSPEEYRILKQLL